MARRIFVFCMLGLVKTIGHLFFSFNKNTTDGKETDWNSVRVIAWINHTSLFDLFLICTFPYRFLWQASKDCMTPIAEKTVKRPILGLLFRNLTSKKTFVSQKRDDSWNQFLDSIDNSSIVALFPEGRMKRKNGLDKQGRKLTIRGGIADILQKKNEGKMLIIYSGGMHHIQAPGEKWPKLFQTIHVRLESTDISEYKNSLKLKKPFRPNDDLIEAKSSMISNELDDESLKAESFKTEVIKDLTERRSKNLSLMEVSF